MCHSLWNSKTYECHEQDGTAFIRWHLAKAAELMNVNNELRTQFLPVIAEIQRFSEMGCENAGGHGFIGLKKMRHWRTGLNFYPSITIADFDTVDAAQKAMDAITTENKQSILAIKAVGLSLNYRRRKGFKATEPEYLDFPFRGE